MSSKDRHMPTDILDQIREEFKDRELLINIEVEAYLVLQAIESQSVSSSVLKKLKEAAKCKHPKSYSDQLSYVKNALRIEPVKELLLKMESIIGNACYNGSMQNYGPGGVLVDEGRDFRYPVVFADKSDRHWRVPSDIEADVLIRGRYRFGSNELNIFSALMKIIELLQNEYGFQLPEQK